MEDNTSKGIHLGAGVIMTIVLVAVAITLLMLGVSLMQKGGSQATDMANNLGNQLYTSYDNKIVQGDTINSLIAQYEASAEISIVVSVGGSEQQFIRESSGASKDGEATLGDVFDHATESEALKKAGDKTDENYISATKHFLCVVCKNPNTDAITAMYFTDELD